MADTKGITIQFKGDTVEFDRSLDGVNRSLKTLKSEMSQINKQLKLDPTNVELLKRKFENLQQQQKVAKEQVKLYQEELDKIDKSEIGSKKWTDLNKKLGDAEVNLQKLNAQVDQLGGSNSNMIAFGEQLTSASKKTQDLANAMKGVSVAGAAVVTALTGITVKAAANADDINTLAKQYNLTTDEIQKFQLAAELIDTDLSTITKSYARLTKNMTSNSSTVQEAFARLGVTVREDNGELRSSNDVFNELIKALAQVSNETEQDNLAMQIFGKSAADLGTLINGGSEQLAEFSKYLEENSLVLSQEELDSLNEVNDAIDTIKATLSAFANKVALAYAPKIQEALNKVSEFIIKIKNKWEELSPALQMAIPIISGILAALAPALTVISKLEGVVGKLALKLGTGAGGLGGIISKLVNPLGLAIAAFAAMYATSEEFRNAINNLVGSLITGLKPILDNLIEIFTMIISQLGEFLMPIIKTLGDWFGTYILPALTELMNVILPIISGILEILKDVLDKIVGWLKKLWQYLKDIGVINAFAAAFEALGKVIETVVGWVQSAVSWFGSLIDKAKEWLGINSQVNDLSSGGFGGGSGGGHYVQSGGYGSNGFVMNTTINVNNNGSAITSLDVNRWADTITNRVNENLGRLI